MATDDAQIIIPKGNDVNIEQTINLPKNLKAPVSDGQIVGNVTFTLNGETIAECELVADRWVDSIKVFSMNKLVFNEWFSILRK